MPTPRHTSCARQSAPSMTATPSFRSESRTSNQTPRSSTTLVPNTGLTPSPPLERHILKLAETVSILRGKPTPPPTHEIPPQPPEPPPYKPPSSPIAATPLPAPLQPRPEAEGIIQDVKYIAVGAVLVFVICILLVVAFVALWGMGNLTEAFSLSLLFLSAIAGATILGYRTAAQGAQKAAVIGGIAAALPLIIIVVVILLGSTQATYVGPEFYKTSLNYLFFAALLVLIGAIGGALGAYVRQRTLGRQYVTY
jgi:hypothetical protein